MSVSDIEVHGFHRVVDEATAEQAKQTDRIFKGDDGILYSMLEMKALMMEPWRNNSCLGYVISALEHLKYDPKEIKRVVSAIKEEFDCTTIDEADSHYCSSPY